MPSLVYNSFMRDIATGQVDCDTDTFKMLLVTSSYAASKSHSKRSDVTSGEVANGGGYTTGGNACALTVAATDNANNDVEISFSVTSWTSATITARAGVIYKSRGGLATADELVGYVDFLSNITSTNGTFAVTVSTPLSLTNPS
jgi:hypothetical protein